MKSEVRKVRDSRSQALGAVYTPSYLAEWLALEIRSLGVRPRVILDPAAGEGALLDSAGVTFPDAQLRGFDLDSEVVSSLRKRGYTNKRIGRNSLEFGWGLSISDTLVFANPPWGATMMPNERLRAKDSFNLARGQFDIYDLFVEKTLDELPEGGVGAFFLPDSILLPQHSLTRKLLTEKSQILMFTRLGEGFFDGVFMGSIAIVFRKGSPSPKHKVKFHRVSREQFSRVSAGETTLAQELLGSDRRILQSHFRRDPECKWNFQMKPDVVRMRTGLIPNQISQAKNAWDEWFTSGRGLEFGRSGHLLRCPDCRSLKPVPRQLRSITCADCTRPLSNFDQIKVLADRQPAKGNWVKFVAGEDVHRYSVTPSRWLNCRVKGLNHKSELLGERRLLVRKTGIGIHAAVAEGVLATSQTVYSFTPRPGAPDYAVDFACAVLSSRLVNALHLASSGETEWRSHPYVTQSIIKSLPLPLLVANSAKESLAKKLSKLAFELSASPKSDNKVDSEVEYLVAKVMGWDEEMIDWSVTFLSKVNGSSYARQLATTFVPILMRKSA